jgi:hypothetical protein
MPPPPPPPPPSAFHLRLIVFSPQPNTYATTYGSLIISLVGQRKRDAVETICGDLALEISGELPEDQQVGAATGAREEWWRWRAVDT